MKTRWAVPVALLPNELFSTWLVRAALSQGCDPLVLTGELWPRWRVWTRDPDRGLSDEHLSALTVVSGIESATFHLATLRPTAVAVTQTSIENLAIWPWVLAFGSRNRKRHGGLQYCPHCLQDDKTPYFRLEWRLAWHTNCPIHEVLLMDRCPNCNAPLEPHRLLAEAGHLAVCATCKGDLRECAVMDASIEALAFQRCADEILKSCNELSNGGVESVGGWFDRARILLRIFRRTDYACSSSTGLVMELLPVGDRARLLAGIWKKINNDHERSLSIPKQSKARIKRSESHMSTRHRLTNQPRSRSVVFRMFARLQRRVLVSVR